MSTQRDELARIVNVEGAWCGECEFAGWDSCAECRRSCRGFADAILAAGYSKPRTITTVEELRLLPSGSIIHMTNTRAPFLRTEDGWESTRLPGKTVWDYTNDPSYLPATVLYEPTA